MNFNKDEELLHEMIEYHKEVKQSLLDARAHVADLEVLDRQYDKEITEFSRKVLSAPASK